MKRHWGPDIELADEWNTPFSIAKKGAYFYWTHPVLYPCDNAGFRIPTGYKCVKEKYAAAVGLTKVFCVGGSTTFGLFNRYEDSYPANLESLLPRTAVFNFGLCGMDSAGSMHMLLELLRTGCMPDVVIFLDGINEKQGWMQATEGRDAYEEVSWQYRCLHEVVYNDNMPMALSWKKKTADVQGVEATPAIAEKASITTDPLKFVVDQAASYLMTHRTIQKLAEAWNFRTLFLLEPTVWDVWDGPHDLHFDYIKRLYRSILSGSSDVIDLSKATALKPDNFIEWKHVDADGNAQLASAISAHFLG